ncbi:MAG: hypothetical protein JWR09_997 [Mucilaginibacter sp.]|nr:hypothetical protein [Mucilaginibacter sp.]
MFYKIFSLKVEDAELHFQDANFLVSPPFSKSDVNDLITEKLREINYVPDLNTISYVIKDNQLYVEGIAYEEPQPIEFYASF